MSIFTVALGVLQLITKGSSSVLAVSIGRILNWECPF